MSKHSQAEFYPLGGPGVNKVEYYLNMWSENDDDPEPECIQAYAEFIKDVTTQMKVDSIKELGFLNVLPPSIRKQSVKVYDKNLLGRMSETLGALNRFTVYQWNGLLYSILDVEDSGKSKIILEKDRSKFV